MKPLDVEELFDSREREAPCSLSFFLSLTPPPKKKTHKNSPVTAWSDPGVVPRDGEESSSGPRASGDGGGSAAAGCGNGSGLNGSGPRKLRSTDAGELDALESGTSTAAAAAAASNGVSSVRASPLSSSSPTAAAAAAAAAAASAPTTTRPLPPPSVSSVPSSSLADSLAALFADEEEEASAGSSPSTPSSSPLNRLCVACRSVRPVRAKHCPRLGRCVALYDHRCPWLGCTIGGGNRHAFLWFLVLETLAVVVAAVAAVARLRAVGAAAAAAEGAAAGVAGAAAATTTATTTSDPTSPLSGFPSDTATTAAAVEAALWIAAFLVADLFVLFSLAALLGTQLWQASRALTTNEAANWRRYPHLQDRRGKFSNPHDEGCWSNLVSAMTPPKGGRTGGRRGRAEAEAEAAAAEEAGVGDGRRGASSSSRSSSR